MTLQRFLRGYPRLCGMTGTAQDSAAELQQSYGLDVVVIPTHRPMVRVDRADLVFTHREAKERAVVDEIQPRARHRTPGAGGNRDRDGVGASGRAPARSRACAARC